MNKISNHTVWLLDLDNTLHYADAGIFQSINDAMAAFIAKELRLTMSAAHDLREQYWCDYGATLAGLRLHHPEINVQQFLQTCHVVHELLPLLSPVEGVRTVLQALPGRKVIFSNAPQFYIVALCEAMDILMLLDDILGIDCLDYWHKPSLHSFEMAFQKLQVLPEQCVLVDDSLFNIQVASELGITTVWVDDSHAKTTVLGENSYAIHSVTDLLALVKDNMESSQNILPEMEFR